MSKKREFYAEGVRDWYFTMNQKVGKIAIVAHFKTAAERDAWVADLDGYDEKKPISAKAVWKNGYFPNMNRTHYSFPLTEAEHNRFSNNKYEVLRARKVSP